MSFSSSIFPFELHTLDTDSGDFDSIVIVYTGIGEEHFKGLAAKYFSPLSDYFQFDKAAESEITLLVLPKEVSPIQKVIYSPIPPLDDYDDVRSFSNAAKNGIKRALQSGAKKPLVLLPSLNNGFPHAELATVLGALEGVYVPLEVREAIPERVVKVTSLGLTNFSSSSERVLKLASAIESGRAIARDIGGSDPERMAAPKVAHFVSTLFENTPIKVEILEGESLINQEFPLLAAVNRAAQKVERHQARVILLTYEPEGPIDTTLVLVGKGVTYDTGGADIKHGGAMAGMHRDKCGAAAVAGFFQVLNILKPKGIKVLGGMSMVRNSVGADSYVSDEIITARSGVRVRIGNTDAEGRMAMADVLCYLKEKTLDDDNTHLFTIATLTGHACLAVGSGYSIIMDNGPAKKSQIASKIQSAGEQVGDMFEISTLHPEDFSFNKGKSEYEDVLQCNNLPSSKTPRGHQIPAAFLITVAGLDKHGIKSDKPLKYSHVDIAASEGDFPGIPSGAPISAFTSHFLFSRV